MSARHCIVGAIFALSVSAPVLAQTTDVEFFEAKIRPVLVQRCYSCHNSKMAAPKGDLVLDTKEGLLKGGASGPALVPGKPADSRLLKVLSYTDPLVQMPPSGKLARRGSRGLRAVDCQGRRGSSRERTGARVRVASVQGHVARGGPQVVGVPAGRRACRRRASRRGARPAAPNNRSTTSSSRSSRRRTCRLSPQADKRTLVTRAYVDLLGFKPTYEEVQAFVNDRSPNAYENLIDRLLASPHYGERWGRHWMDVARYGEDNPTSEATNPPYPFAWRYRDWIIEAMNADVPYDRFVKLQLAADLMPDAKRDDLRALGYLGRRADLSQRPAAVGRRDRHVPDRRLGRADRRGVARRARPDGGVRALPRSQVRSDHARRTTTR